MRRNTIHRRSHRNGRIGEAVDIEAWTRESTRVVVERLDTFDKCARRPGCSSTVYGHWR